MKWSDFFSKNFGIDANADMPNTNTQNTSGGAENTTPVNTNDTPAPPTTPPPAPSSESINITAQLKELQEQVKTLQTENTNIKSANAKLLAGMSLENNADTPVEEDIYNLLFGGKQNVNEGKRTADMQSVSAS